MNRFTIAMYNRSSLGSSLLGLSTGKYGYLVGLPFFTYYVETYKTSNYAVIVLMTPEHINHTAFTAIEGMLGTDYIVQYNERTIVSDGISSVDLMAMVSAIDHCAKNSVFVRNLSSEYHGGNRVVYRKDVFCTTEVHSAQRYIEHLHILVSAALARRKQWQTESPAINKLLSDYKLIGIEKVTENMYQAKVEDVEALIDRLYNYMCKILWVVDQDEFWSVKSKPIAQIEGSAVAA